MLIIIMAGRDIENITNITEQNTFKLMVQDHDHFSFFRTTVLLTSDAAAVTLLVLPQFTKTSDRLFVHCVMVNEKRCSAIF